ncbi:MAG: hypothetical protein BGN92_12935 [Sphingobacteriales bacterium 41-5]|nr:MAG: hypothetical protein BGN92_12935 [Sphingobacteriales bacterium 41-5]
MNDFIKNIKVSWANKCTDSIPTGVAELAKMIQSGKRKEQAMYMRDMPTSSEDEVKAQKKYKAENFPVLFPVVLSGGTSNNDVSEDAQVIIVDIDASDNPGVSVDEMFNKLMPLPHVCAIATSIRGAGVYAVIRIKPTRSNEDFHLIAKSLAFDFSNIGLTIDEQCKNIARKRFFGYSDRYWFNENEPEIYLPHWKIPALKTAKKALQVNAGINKKIKEIQLSDYRPLAELINEVEAQKLDVAPTYDNYLNLAFALAGELNEDGRNIFHSLCQYSPDYNSTDADLKYTNAIETGRGDVPVNFVFDLIKRAGVVVEDFGKIKEKNAALRNYTTPQAATIKRREYDYPKEWDMPIKKDAIYNHWRLINALDNLEYAVLNSNNEKAQEQCSVLEDIGLPTIPVSLFAEHAPTAYKILNS